MFVYCVCFFFKQKTAYELRISDWSSDVCSSDLDHLFDFGRQFGGGIAGLFQRDLHGAAAAQFAAAHAEDAVGTAAIGRQLGGGGADQIGRASCRERVCQYV